MIETAVYRPRATVTVQLTMDNRQEVAAWAHAQTAVAKDGPFDDGWHDVAVIRVRPTMFSDVETVVEGGWVYRTEDGTYHGATTDGFTKMFEPAAQQ